MHATPGPGRWLFVCARCSDNFGSDYDVYCGVGTVGMVREIVPEVRARKLVLPNVCVVGSLGHRECDVGISTLCSTGIRSLYNSNVYCDVFTVGVVREIAPEVRTRKLVSPEGVMSAEVCDTRSCAGPSGPQF